MSHNLVKFTRGLRLKTCGLIIIFFNMMLPATIMAQVCTPAVTPQTISPGNFDFQIPNLARDKLTGLQWHRCVYGQVWDGNTCSGNPKKLTWAEALREAEINGLRLPSIKEINSILDLQCIVPPTNLEIFPNTPGSNANGLWSSTPYIPTGTAKTNAWYVDLGFGFANYRDVDSKNFARFVVK